MKFTLDLELDRYDSELEMQEACIQFIKEQLNFTASSISNVKRIPDDFLVNFKTLARVSNNKALISGMADETPHRSDSYYQKHSDANDLAFKNLIEYVEGVV